MTIGLKKKREYRLGNKPVQNRLGENCFHYSMIDTSKRAIIDNAINIKAILHAENLLNKGKLYIGPKKKRWS